MYTIIRILPLGLAAFVFCSGCQTVSSQKRHDEAVRLRGEVKTMQQDMRRLEARLEAFEADRDMLYQRMDGIQQQVEENTRVSETRLGQVEQAQDDLRSSMAKDKQQVVETLTSEMADLINRSRPPAPASAHGYEHVVQQGETLSEIASAYNVTPAAIIRANSLQDPNRISVGQVLFIPE